MAATTIISTAAKVPWKQILVLLPDVAKAAKGIWNHWNSKPKPAPLDPSASVASQIGAIADRILALESNEANQSQVVSQIVEQLGALATGLKETSARQTLHLRLSIGSLILAACAIAAALLV